MPNDGKFLNLRVSDMLIECLKEGGSLSLLSQFTWKPPESYVSGDPFNTPKSNSPIKGFESIPEGTDVMAIPNDFTDAPIGQIPERDTDYNDISIPRSR